MKIDISLSEWKLLDFCLTYTFRQYMNGSYEENSIKCASEINKLKNKLSMQLSKTQIKKDL